VKRLLFLLVLVNAGFAADRNPFDAPDPRYEFKEIQTSSLYLPMRDGVRLAIDVLIPKDLPPDKKIPAILKFTRYGRAPVNGSTDFLDRFWVKNGFARVLIDQRGTGASFGGVRYGKANLNDMRDIADWVVRQPWCNGKLGAIGDSYEGTTSELLAATGHPAVRAVAPNFSDYNYYTDLIRPGGALNDWFTKLWQYETAHMDKGMAAKRVDADADGSLLKQAVAEHKANPNVYNAAKAGEFIDDPSLAFGGSSLDLGISGVSQELQQSRVPMLVLASWFDAATVQGTLQRFKTFSSQQRVFIGAFGHGGFANANPFSSPDVLPDPPPRQQLLEALRFFNHYLKEIPDAVSSERRLHYFTVGENTWKSTESWPPAGFHTVSYHLRTDHGLGAEQSGNLSVTFVSTSTGDQNRWHTQGTEGVVAYGKAIQQMSALPAFATVPLETAIEITGQPVLRLNLECSQADPTVFAYLIALDPQGNPTVLTEGQLRLIHRKLNKSEQTLHTYTRADAAPVPSGKPIEADITLLPMSAVLPKGYRLQLLLASNDTSTFASAPQYGGTVFASSQIDLPEKERPDYIPPAADKKPAIIYGAPNFQGRATIIYMGLLQGLLRIRVVLHQAADQSWTGSLTSLDDSGLERPLDAIRINKDGEIHFTWKIPLFTSYRGRFSSDGNQIIGTISQGKKSDALNFDNVTEPVATPSK
jgi:putative CocE/NonD family hydrolase